MQKWNFFIILFLYEFFFLFFVFCFFFQLFLDFFSFVALEGTYRSHGAQRWSFQLHRSKINDFMAYFVWNFSSISIQKFFSNIFLRIFFSGSDGSYRSQGSQWWSSQLRRSNIKDFMAYFMCKFSSYLYINGKHVFFGIFFFVSEVTYRPQGSQWWNSQLRRSKINDFMAYFV